VPTIADEDGLHLSHSVSRRTLSSAFALSFSFASGSSINAFAR
jgi:hypothetical protein